MTTAAELYFPYTLKFDIGDQPVTLYGAILASNQELSFALSQNIILNPQLFPADEATQSIKEPFGMTGVVLKDLGIRGHIYKDPKNNDKTAADITLTATAGFSKIENFSLSGAIVFENTSPRLVLVTLSVDKPLTIKQFVTSVIGGSWYWTDEITDQFAFQSGEMYYLKSPEKDRNNYTFSYPVQNAKKYYPGYHIDGTLQIFEQYNFVVKLDVEGKEISLSTTFSEKIDFDFVALVDPKLEISTKSKDQYLRISTKVEILNTSSNISILAGYNFKEQAFLGAVSFNLGSLSLPTGSGTRHEDVKLDIEFTWKKGSRSDSGFKITKIGGLPTNTLNLIKDFLEVLNSGDGCEKIVEKWLDGLTETTLTPELNGSPSKTDNGQMKLPLKLAYEIKVGGSPLASRQIKFEAIFAIPGSLNDLPGAIWKSIIASSSQIAQDILSDPNTYEVITIEAAKKGGEKALARFICRTLEKISQPLEDKVKKALEDLVKKLANNSTNILSGGAGIGAGIGTIAEGLAVFGLLLMLFVVSLLGIGAIIQLGGSGAEAEINNIKEKIENLEKQIKKIKEQIKINSLRTTINIQKQFLAEVAWNLDNYKNLESGIELFCDLRLLPGEVKSTQWPILPEPPSQLFTVMNNSLSENQDRIFEIVKNWAEIPNNSEYRMNASVKSILRGFTFLNPQAEKSITEVIDNLKKINNEMAPEFASYLQGKLCEFQSYNKYGIESDWVYADSDIPSYSTVGKTYIGINSRVLTTQNHL